jgi:hypothetical protein
MNTKYVHHTHPHSPFPYAHPPPTGTHPANRSWCVGPLTRLPTYNLSAWQPHTPLTRAASGHGMYVVTQGSKSEWVLHQTRQKHYCLSTQTNSGLQTSDKRGVWNPETPHLDGGSIKVTLWTCGIGDMVLAIVRKKLLHNFPSGYNSFHLTGNMHSPLPKIPKISSDVTSAPSSGSCCLKWVQDEWGIPGTGPQMQHLECLPLI